MPHGHDAANPKNTMGIVRYRYGFIIEVSMLRRIGYCKKDTLEEQRE